VSNLFNKCVRRTYCNMPHKHSTKTATRRKI